MSRPHRASPILVMSLFVAAASVFVGGGTLAQTTCQPENSACQTGSGGTGVTQSDGRAAVRPGNLHRQARQQRTTPQTMPGGDCEARPVVRDRNVIATAPRC